MILAIVLIVVGGVVLLAGELLGVASKERNDTVTDWVVSLRNKTRGLFLIPLFAGMAWLAYHFAVAS